MTPLLSIILLVLISYLGWLFYKEFSPRSALLNHIYISGSLYLLIGVLIGPRFLSVLDMEIIANLHVLLGLVLGWTGFLIGLQAKVHELKRFQEGYYLFATVNFILMLTGSLILILAVSHALHLDFNSKTLAILAIAGTVSSPIFIAILRKEFKLRGHSVHLMQFSAAFDNMLGVLMFGIILILVNPLLALSVTVIIVFIATLTFSGIMAYLFYVISKRINNEQQFLLLLIGFLLVIVGAALNVHISLICTSFFFGIVLTNLPLDTKKMYHSIAQAEKPIYYLMLIFVGASIDAVFLQSIYLVIIFILIRLILKFSSGYAARLSIFKETRPTKMIGFTNLGIGGLAVAMILDYHVSYPTITSRSLLFAIALAMVITTMISPRWFKQALDL